MEQSELIFVLLGVFVALVGAFLLGQAFAGKRVKSKEIEQETPKSLAHPHDPSTTEAPASAQLSQTPAEAQQRQSVQQAEAEVSWFARLSAGLSKTQSQLVRQLEGLFVSREERASREALLDSILEVLVRADVGIRTSELLLEKVRTALPVGENLHSGAVLEILREEILKILLAPHQAQSAQSAHAKDWSLVDEIGREPRVVLMVGVNGVGKTTTTGKLAFKERRAGRSVIVGAADTFRAAAVDQLEEWARRAGAECVRLTEGADPASVAFECVKKAISQHIDLCLIDTAGRLHNRNDLMQELGKIRRVTSKDLPSAPHDVLLVLDATTGQNALQQARAFKEIAGVTGIVLTKLDGTAKGGIAIALAAELNIPIRYIGVGESVEDLHIFDATEFVDALFAPTSAAPSLNATLPNLQA